MRFFHVLLALVITSLLSTLSSAQTREPDNLLSNGDFSRNEASWELPTGGADTSFVAAQAGPFRRALHIVLSPMQGEPPYSIALRQALGVALKKGDPLVMRVWLRSPSNNTIGAFVEQAAAPYAKLISQELKLTPQWKQYEIRGTSQADYPTEGTRVIFHLGYAPGVVEITGVRVFSTNATVAAGHSNATPEHPESLITNGDFSGPTTNNWTWTTGPNLQAQIVPADIAVNQHALHLTLNPDPKADPWAINMNQTAQRWISRDDALYLRAWMRSPDRVHVGLFYELAAAPNTKSLSQTVQLTPKWKEYRFVGYTKQTFGPGESRLVLHLGHDKGVMEITGVRLENYGKAPPSMFSETIDYWGGQQPTDDWRAPALERIEKIREGDVKVRVVDATGQLVPGATVKIEQQAHYFRFGTAAPVARILDQKHPDSVRFQQELKRLYNTLTFESDLKWTDINESKLQQVEQAIPWLHANGIINIRGHNLLWGSKQCMPQAVQNLSKEELLKACHDHVTALASRMRGKVYLWDVVNEAATNTWLWDTIGWENFANAYKWAHEADPTALLCYNDYDIINEAQHGPAQRLKVKARIQYLLDHGAPLDVLGFQGHMGAPLTTPSRIIEIVEEMAKFNKPIEITEFDAGIPDDQVHGQYVRDCMTALFSEPAIHAFVMWGFWEGAHWRAAEGGAMFRKDWSKRPAQEAYEDLVFHQWWTNATLTTDTAGQANTRAFYGLHHVTITKDGQQTTQTLQLLPGTPGEMVVKLVNP
ncbi:MAG: endo-1,4-beta-xylanase [Abitibacteriaceae bacterium]|nr:endo-1,4-beta-xylanase [Abditibacteriaceae bacterium]